MVCLNRRIPHDLLLYRCTLQKLTSIALPTLQLPNPAQRAPCAPTPGQSLPPWTPAPPSSRYVQVSIALNICPHSSPALSRANRPASRVLTPAAARHQSSPCVRRLPVRGRLVRRWNPLGVGRLRRSRSSASPPCYLRTPRQYPRLRLLELVYHREGCT